MGVNLCPDPESGDICLFAYMSLRNHQHRWETEVQPTAEFDLNTGAYSAESAERMARYALQKAGQALCALAVIHVGGVSELLGEGDGNRQKQDILTALNVFLDTDSILWRKDDDTPLRLLPQRRLARHPQATAGKRLFLYARFSWADVKALEFLRFVAGAVCMSADKADFDRMRSGGRSHLRRP